MTVFERINSGYCTVFIKNLTLLLSRVSTGIENEKLRERYLMYSMLEN